MTDAKESAAFLSLDQITDEMTLTKMLQKYSDGDKRFAEAILREVLPRLRQAAARELGRERSIVPLSPTELISEIWLQNLHKGGWPVRDRQHFYAIASRAMRHVLVDLARKRLAQRRGEGIKPFSLDSPEAQQAQGASPEQLYEIGQLMDQLERVQPQTASVVEMHYFAGLTLEEIAAHTGLTPRQVRHLWNKGRLWLRERLG